MPKGRALKFTRADLEPLWRDPSLSQEQIADRLGCGREALRRYARIWGLPRRPRASRAEYLRSRGQYGKRLDVGLDELRPLWFDPDLTLRDIARELGCCERSAWVLGRRLGLPPRETLRKYPGDCDKCSCHDLCVEWQATARRFPCQPEDEWDQEEMERRRDGDRVGSSPQEGRVVYTNKRERAG